MKPKPPTPPPAVSVTPLDWSQLIVSALREMETQNIVTSHLDSRGAEIWSVKR